MFREDGDLADCLVLECEGILEVDMRTIGEADAYALISWEVASGESITSLAVPSKEVLSKAGLPGFRDVGSEGLRHLFSPATGACPPPNKKRESHRLSRLDSTLR
jgi:hypothetical protein